MKEIKIPSPEAGFVTSSTDFSAFLRSVGFNAREHNFAERTFSEKNPPNPAVSHGLARGGVVEFHHSTKSEEFPNTTPHELLYFWMHPEVDAGKFDDLLNKLADITAGTAAGTLVAQLAQELPRELLRYTHQTCANRKEQITGISKGFVDAETGERRHVPERTAITNCKGHPTFVPGDGSSKEARDQFLKFEQGLAQL